MRTPLGVHRRNAVQLFIDLGNESAEMQLLGNWPALKLPTAAA